MFRFQVAQDLLPLGEREHSPDQGQGQAGTAHIAYSTL
jgi:hypothetical protein